MANALSRLERVYMALQGAGSDTDFATPASLGNSNYVRHIKATAKNNVAVLLRRDKTGTRTPTVGVKGREYGTWSYEGSLAPSGVNGTQPDFDPLMQSLFGQAAVSAGGGLRYAFVDTPLLAFTMGIYRTPSTLNQHLAVGCLAKTATFKVGEDIAEWTAEGECKFVEESDYFSSATTEELMGLGSFPAEPGAPVSHGGIIAGFTGLISIGGTTITRIRTATIKVETGQMPVKDVFGTYTPVTTEADWRNVTLAFSMYEDDTAGQQAIRKATISKTPVNASITVGTVAGSIVDFELINVQLASYDLDDSAIRYSLSVPESRAFGTDVTSLDELKITIK